MLRNIREKLCCSGGDTADGNDQPPKPVTVFQEGNGEAETTTSSPPLIEQKPAKWDLWKEAYDSLDDDRKKHLNLAKGASTTDAIDDVIEKTGQKYREWKGGGLKIRNKNGNDFNVHDTAEKILNSAMQAKNIITTVVSFDPTGHASAAWTIVSLGLSMVQNHQQFRDSVFDASAYLADILAYYTLVDTHHRNKNVESDQHLDNALLGVYTALLNYSAQVNKEREGNSIRHTFKCINAIADQPLTQLKASVESKAQGADKWADLSYSLHAREVAEDTLNKIDESIGLLRSVESKTLSAEEERTLAWVSTADYSKFQKETQEARTPGTGNWLLASEHYKAWMASPGSILWLYGVVGCGKSVLCSTVIHDIERLCQHDPSKSFAYWYFQFSNDQTRSVENLIRCLIRQFSQKPLAPSVTRMWEEHSPRGSQPDRKTLSDTLNDVLSNATGESFLVLDALDECPEETRHSERKMLLSLLVDLAERHKDKLHILATSRPEQDIQSKLARFPTIDLEARLAEDVEIFVHAEVGEGILRGLGQQTQNRIIDGLLRTRERRFRWADLQIKRLSECNTDEQIEKALQTMPETLEETYREVLDRIPGKDHDIALSILRLICLSPVPLDLPTVADAVSLRTPDLVIKICTTSLVTVSGDEMIKLAHFSVKEFLVVPSTAKKDHWCRFLEIEGHAALADKSVDLLLTQRGTSTKESTTEQPFLVYAAMHFGTHVAALGEIAPDLQGRINRLFTESNIYLNWIRLSPGIFFSYDRPWMNEECHPPICQASKMGFKRTVELLLAQGADPLSSFDPLAEENSLTEAIRSGHVDILELLLSKVPVIPRRSVKRVLGNINHRHIGEEKLQAVFNILWDRAALYSESEKSRGTIDEDMVDIMVRNENSGLELLDLLLARRDHVSIPITIDILTSVVASSSRPDEIMELLFEKCNDDIQITRDFLLILPHVHGASNVPNIVLSRRGAEISLDEDIISMFVSNADWRIVDVLLRTCGRDIPINEDILIKAAKNQSGDAAIIRFLFDKRDPGTEISENVFIAAAGNDWGLEIMTCLLDELAPNMPLTESVMQAMVGNATSGLDMVKIVIDRQQPGFTVSQDALAIAAASKGCPVEMLQLLVNNGGSSVPVTEKMVLRGAQNDLWGPDVIGYLLELHGNSLPMTEDILVAIVENTRDGSVKVFGEIFETFPDVGMPDRVVQAACKHINLMPILLERAPDQLPIRQMVEQIGTFEIGQDQDEAGQMLQLLFDRQLVDINEWLVETVARNPFALKAVFDQKPDAPVTQKTVLRAARNLNSLRVLLFKRKNEVTITEEVMMVIARGYFGSEYISLIIDQLGSAPITGKVFKEAAISGMKDTLALLLELQHDLKPRVVLEDIWRDAGIDAPTRVTATQDILALTDLGERLAILQDYPWNQNDDYGFDKLIAGIHYRRIPLPATEQLGELVMERCSNEVIEGFLERKRDILITDKFVQAAERNPRADKECLLSLLTKKRG